MVETPSAARSRGRRQNLDLARVLLVHGELAPRLALRTILEAGGYSVDVAATPAEGFGMLDARRYDLVLTAGESDWGSVLAYARVKDYKPATAVVRSDERLRTKGSWMGRHEISVYTENLPGLLERVAELIGIRAIRRYRLARQGA